MAVEPTPITRLRAVKLRDERRVHVREIRSGDEPELLSFLERLSFRSTSLRFCCGGPNLAEIAHGFVDTGAQRIGVVALAADGQIVAHAEAVTLSASTAEVAVVVADAFQGLGLAGRLIECLCETARARGIRRFVAEVSPDNEAMLGVFAGGFSAAVIESGSVCAVEFETAMPVAQLVAA